MDWNKDGFLIPYVDTSTCVNCGLCSRMCPAQPDAVNQNQYDDNPDTVVAYGTWNQNKNIHLQSSSGGVFSALAEKVFAEGGCVFGVVWQDKDNATYARAENPEQLAPMRGSKYVQAFPKHVYREVKEELSKGRNVLFSGTACQVYALKQYLRKAYNNLITIDIVCHGTPSRKLLQAYQKHFETTQNKEIKEIFFRFKDGNWQEYKVQKRFTDGTTLNHSNWDDLFMRLFIGDFVLNKACYDCPHAHFPRPGDLTLGDYWGDLQKLHPDWPIKDGIGSIIANTTKGREIIESLAQENKITLKREPFINLYKGQPWSYLRKNSSIHPFRKHILQMIDSKPITQVYSWCFDTFHYGTFHLHKNGLWYKGYKFARKVTGFLRRKASGILPRPVKAQNN